MFNLDGSHILTYEYFDLFCDFVGVLVDEQVSPGKAVILIEQNMLLLLGCLDADL